MNMTILVKWLLAFILLTKLLTWSIDRIAVRRRIQEVIRFYLIKTQDIQKLAEASQPRFNWLLGNMWRDRFPACSERYTQQLQSYYDPGEVFNTLMLNLDWDHDVRFKKVNTPAGQVCSKLSWNRRERWYCVNSSFAQKTWTPPEKTGEEMSEWQRYAMWCGIRFKLDEIVRAFTLFKQHLKSIQLGEVLLIRHEFCEPSPSDSSEDTDEKRPDEPSRSAEMDPHEPSQDDVSHTRLKKAKAVLLGGFCLAGLTLCSLLLLGSMQPDWLSTGEYALGFAVAFEIFLVTGFLLHDVTVFVHGKPKITLGILTLPLSFLIINIGYALRYHHVDPGAGALIVVYLLIWFLMCFLFLAGYAKITGRYATRQEVVDKASSPGEFERRVRVNIILACVMLVFILFMIISQIFTP